MIVEKKYNNNNNNNNNRSRRLESTINAVSLCPSSFALELFRSSYNSQRDDPYSLECYSKAETNYHHGRIENENEL